MPVGRRAGTLMCLVLTALTLWLLPGSLQALLAGRASRAPERLLPKETRRLIVWWIGPDDTDSARLLSRLLAAFEKETGDVRAYLRRADASELAADTAVLPDAVLFPAYALAGAEERLLALAGDLPVRADALCAGRSAQVQRAAPLWFSPGVLAVPEWALTDASPAATPEPAGWLSPRETPATPAPQGPWVYADSPAHPERIPWDALLGHIAPPVGTALPQLVLCAPARLRASLAGQLTQEAVAAEALPTPNGAQEAAVPAVSCAGQATPAPTAHGWPFAAPVAGRATPKPPAREQAYRAWRQGGSGAAFALVPAVCDRALFLGLCREGEAARELFAYLYSPAAQREIAAHGLFSCARDAAWPADTEAARALGAVYASGLVLPNAFAHARQEADALCRAGLGDPAAALLRLR